MREAVAIALKDEAPEVALLARVIQEPGPKIVDNLKERLYSPEFETSWQVLRVLRVVPLPELASDVCQQLGRSASGTPLTYDAIYALSNPVMARAAAGRYLAADHAVELVLAEGWNADRNSVDSFTNLLAAFDRSEVEGLLARAERDASTAPVARLVRQLLAQHRGSEGPVNTFVAGYASDTIDIENDPLGVREDVQTLTAIIMAREVKPPLAIGLFGDWGSGKSYFMESMQAAAQGLAKRALSSPASRFCSSIVPIRFNAWHYADTNLWASLVSTILEKLSAFVTPGLTSEEQQAALLAELNSAKAAVSEAEAEKGRAKALIDESEKELQRLQVERQRKEIRLRDLQAPDLEALLPANLKKKLETVLAQLGVPALARTVEDLSQVVADGYTVRGRLTALVAAMVNGDNRRLLRMLAGVVLLSIAGYVLAVRYLDLDRLLATTSAVIAQATAILATVSVALRKAFVTARTQLEQIEQIKRTADQLIAEKRAKPSAVEVQLQTEITTLRTREVEASSLLSAAASKVVDLEQRLLNLKEGRSLSRFLAERSRSDDYRRHLGLVSTIRLDFESLAERLAPSRSDLAQGLQPVDRIILFIDDLDRCPAEKVMDVLQAVHLLLAYPLFVVVVGVDPRWLLHSLGTTFAAFEGTGARYATDTRRWQTTPQNYLEKIFQIPFNLSQMSDAGYARLIRSLLPPEIEREPHLPTVAVRPPTEDSSSEKPSPNPDQPPVERDEETRQAPVPEPKSEAYPNLESFTIAEEALVIRSWETEFAASLYTLIPTPRAAKRFSNTYRILKARVASDHLPRFEGTHRLPGEFQVPMLLLAMLIGAPHQAAALFPRLLERAAAGDDPTQFLRALPEPVLDSLEQNIRPIVSDEGFPSGADVYLEWLPRVARFSFEVGRVVTRSTPLEEPGQAGVLPRG